MSRYQSGKCSDCSAPTEVNGCTKKHYWKCVSCRKKSNCRNKKHVGSSTIIHKRVIKRSNDWYYNNKEKASKDAKDRWQSIRSKVFDLYGRECKCCGESHIEFLTLDHINNDGAVDRSKNSKYTIHKNAIKIYQPNRYQILCWNCNLAKHQYGECPHSRMPV